MDKPKNLIDAIKKFLNLVATDDQCSPECRKTALKLLAKIKEAEK